MSVALAGFAVFCVLFLYVVALFALYFFVFPVHYSEDKLFSASFREYWRGFGKPWWFGVFIFSQCLIILLLQMLFVRLESNVRTAEYQNNAFTRGIIEGLAGRQRAFDNPTREFIAIDGVDKTCDRNGYCDWFIGFAGGSFKVNQATYIAVRAGRVECLMVSRYQGEVFVHRVCGDRQ